MLRIRDDIKLAVINVHVNELNHVWVVQRVQNVDFLDYFLVVVCFHVLLFYLFHRNDYV